MGAELSRFLFDTLTFLNGFIAVAIIALSTVAGWSYPIFRAAPPLGLLLGALVGVVFAALICGTIAFLALIERHLRTIADRNSGSTAPASIGRQEPRL